MIVGLTIGQCASRLVKLFKFSKMGYEFRKNRESFEQCFPRLSDSPRVNQSIGGTKARGYIYDVKCTHCGKNVPGQFNEILVVF